MGSWLQAADAALLVGCSRYTLWRWHCAGIVPANATLRTGNRVRYAKWWCEGKATP